MRGRRTRATCPNNRSIVVFRHILLIFASTRVSFSYPDYLNAKRTVDARARHPRVWNRFVDHLCRAARQTPGVIRVLEIGAGAGDLAYRIIHHLIQKLDLQEGGGSPGEPPLSVRYTLVDIEKDNLDAARRYLTTTCCHGGDDASLNKANIEFKFVHGDILAQSTIDSLALKSYDGIVGQAVVDLLPVDTMLNVINVLAAPYTYVYLPIHFDGLTSFESIGESVIDPDVDRRVMSLYHASMRRAEEFQREDASSPASADVLIDGARSGRNLLLAAATSGYSIVDTAGSDWIVRPTLNSAESPSPLGSNAYPADEGYFLDCMIDFVEAELDGHRELPADDLQTWVSARRTQRREGRLLLVAHHVDVLLAPPSGGAGFS